MNKLIIVTGPTASGKTSLAIELAKTFNAEIINADSFQVYKEINVGINKPNSNQLKQVKHHLIDSHSIYDVFDIKIFQELATNIIKDIHKRGKNVIICGGSNLYIDALIKGYNLDKTESREQVKYFDNWTYDDIYNYVLEKDPDEAMKINYNNKKRIIRAAQIIYATNTKKSEIDNQKDNYVYDCFIIETSMPRDELYEKINNRTDLMISNDWLNEVKLLLDKDKNVKNLQALKAIGYPQVIESLVNNSKIDVEKIKQATRNLAKKQMTWCRTKYPIDRIVFDNSRDNYEKLKEKIERWIK